MRPAPTEQELIAKAQSGDEQAVALLYEAHVKSIFTFISYKVNSDAVAEDLTSEVFLRMVRQLSNYKYQGFPFKAWLFRIASNLITDFYRQQGRMLGTSVPEEFPSGETDLFDQMATEDEGSRLHLAMSALPEEYQNLLIWRFMQELPHTEIAKFTNKSVDALRAMQYRALKALAEQLDKLRFDHDSFGEETHDR